RSTHTRSPTLQATPRAGVEMLGVVGFVVGPQHDTKVAASTVMGGPEEARVGAIAPPLPAHADLMAVGQREAGDINGIGDGVLAAPVLPELGADDVAAGVGAEALQRPHA